MANNTSPHILNSSVSLLGFCLFIITSLHISNKIETSYIDELTSVVSILLAFSSSFSFFSIRTKNLKKEKLLESIADYFFITALIGIVVIIFLITFNIIH
jgi:uncharacterized membrane protein